MLLGSEYELLSMIAKHYRVHSDGYFKFSENDFRIKFTDELALASLRRLEDRGFVNRGNIITVDSKKWAEFFVSELEKSLRNIGCDYKCTYSSEYNEVWLFSDSELKIKFIVNFDEDKYNIATNTINLCYVSTFDNYLFWLDLLNDVNLLQMFYGYITNEISNLNNKNKISFNFFEGVEDEYLSEIFHVALKKYFRQGHIHIQDLSFDSRQLLHKYIRRDCYEAFELKIGQCIVFVIKVDRKVEFYSFVEDKLKYTSEVIKELKKLENKLQKKISEYRKLSMFNKNKIIENSQKIINIVCIILNPINLVLCALTLLDLPIIKDIRTNLYTIVTIGIILLAISFYLIFIVIVPAFKLSKFEWEINYDK